MNKITEATRRDIFDALSDGMSISNDITNSKSDIYMTVWGRLSPHEFLQRIYRLNELPSYDNRFKSADGDVHKHTVLNDDWDTRQILSDRRFELLYGNDEMLLRFLCGIFHPAVRNEQEPWENFLDLINTLLRVDGYVLQDKEMISGRVSYTWKDLSNENSILLSHMNAIKEQFNSEYMTKEIDLMTSLIDRSSNTAIGKAKQFLEICCKTILEEKEIAYSKSIDLQALVKMTCDNLGLTPSKVKDKDNIPDEAKEHSKKILGSLAGIVHGMAELRNLYGDGHGKAKNFTPLPTRYAHLAVGASATAVKFIWDTYKEKQ